MHAFTPKQRSLLLANRSVLNVTEKSVTYTPDFKIKAVQQFLSGTAPDLIFHESKIPLEFFKEDYARSCLKRWVKKFEFGGEDALRDDGRGTESKGRPREERFEDLTYDELLALVEIQKEALKEVKKQNALARKKKR